MATVHLIHGFTGSGKTTFAKELEDELKAIRFSNDEWMANLYGIAPSPDLFSRFEERISALIWQYVEKITDSGIDCILDFGFWTRESRDAVRLKLEEMELRL